MPKIYNDAARARIDRAVKDVESGMLDLTGMGRGRSMPLTQVWFELNEDLDEETYTADATMCVWSASANSGDGEYTATGSTQTVRDTTDGQCTAKSGDRVLCRPVGSLNGTVWEIIQVVNNGFVLAQLTTALSAGGTATADAGYLDNNNDFVSYGWDPITVVDKFLGSGDSVNNGSLVDTRRLSNGKYLLTLVACASTS